MRSEQLYLTDIVEAAGAIGSFLTGIEYEDFRHRPKSHKWGER